MRKFLIVMLVAITATMGLAACQKGTNNSSSSSLDSNISVMSSSNNSATNSAVSSNITSSSSVASSSTASKSTTSANMANSTSNAAKSNSNNTATTQTATTKGNTRTYTPSHSSTATATYSSSGSTAHSSKSATQTSNYQLVMPTSSQLASLSSQVLALINAERARCGVPALRAESKLTQAAQMRATECSKNFPTYNGHMRPDGTLYATILSEVQYGTRQERQASTDGINWTTQVYYDSGAGAENLVSWWCDPQTLPNGFRATSAELPICAKYIFNDWKNSSGHYRNMISKTFTATGVGCKAVIINDSMSIQCIQIFTEK